MRHGGMVKPAVAAVRGYSSRRSCASRSGEGVDLVAFKKGQRKDDVTQKYVRKFTQREGVLYVGKAQEKARVMRTERRCSRFTGGTYPWIVESTAMVNHYYFYCVDEDFGPFFLKFCSYFPYNAKLCINGNEYLKRQLAKRGVAFEALDNGVKSCASPKLMQRLCDELSADKIDRLLRKWLRRLPHPFPARDRSAGYRYQLSILQAGFSLTQVLDHPVLPIRLLPTPPTCRMLPGSGVKLCVGRCGDVARDAEQGTEGVERIEPPVEAEGEFVEVGLQVLVTDPVMDAVQPRFQVCEDEMDDWQILLGDLRIAPFSDGEVFVAALGKAGVAAPVVGRTIPARSLWRIWNAVS